MDAIGGYFALELRDGELYHREAFALNSARHCLEYLLRSRNCKKIFVPYYTCEVVVEAIVNAQTEYEMYALTAALEPASLPELQQDELFLYTNYYGIKDTTVADLCRIYGSQLIVDNAQAFYAAPIDGIDTFYSPRKFFGVPDGGYLSSSHVNVLPDTIGKSSMRMSHLLKRIEDGAHAGYPDFQRNDDSLRHLGICRMSFLTEKLLRNVDYENVRQRRWSNFEYLHHRLAPLNRLNIDLASISVPMVYPFWTSNGNLRTKLIKNKVFVAKYWPGVADIPHCPELEKDLVENLIPLPIDQRYSQIDMERIVDLITK